MVSGLRDTTVRWTATQTADALETVEDETNRLNTLVGNLLDASRLQIGALAVSRSATSIPDTIATCLHALGAAAAAVDVDPLDQLPLVTADAVLLERSLANLISNALRHTPPGRHVRVQTSVSADTVYVRVIDHGPGIPARDRARVLMPFQRLGDQQTTDGVGLGLSIAQGFINAMGATLTLDDTPGGGLTVTVMLTRLVEPDAPRPRRKTPHGATCARSRRRTTDPTRARPQPARSGRSWPRIASSSRSRCSSQPRDWRGWPAAWWINHTTPKSYNAKVAAKDEA